jgi:tRNA modification GTPase
MENQWVDTITAISTPYGRGGVGVVRVSGPLVCEITQSLFNEIPQPYKAKLKGIYNEKGEMIDKGLVLFFQKPHSFTGEDVLEFHGHGNPVILEMIISVVTQRGARIAMPGEFSKRAFLNNKMDLTQAEAVADLIDASTQTAALSAARSLQGDFSKHIHRIGELLLRLRMFVEASLDFPDEDIEFIEEEKIASQVKDLGLEIETLMHQAKQGQILREGVQVVIAGQPNAGKSSLLNALTQQESAIVTAIAGTTRDLIKECIHIDGLPLQIIDTAGIRANPDAIEQEGIKRAEQQFELADRILLLVDATQRPLLSDVETKLLERFGQKIIVILNKIDLLESGPQHHDDYNQDFVCISAKNKLGITELLQQIKRSVGFVQDEAGRFMARKRHIEALLLTKNHIHAALDKIKKKSLELVAQELRLAHDALGEIVGRMSSDDLLGKIFTSFCIGK